MICQASPIAPEGLEQVLQLYEATNVLCVRASACRVHVTIHLLTIHCYSDCSRFYRASNTNGTTAVLSIVTFVNACDSEYVIGIVYCYQIIFFHFFTIKVKRHRRRRDPLRHTSQHNRITNLNCSTFRGSNDLR